ncbi:MAG: ABC transporter permease [Clostridiaceae bacterium]|nr:ABC transporter permease [Clostridiaceae bacterium]
MNNRIDVNSQTTSIGIFKKLKESREAGLLLIIIIMSILIHLASGNFLTLKTFSDMVKNYSTTFTLALGMLSVLIIGGIDISIAATMAFSGMASSLLMRDGVYSSTFIMFFVSTLVGFVCGLLIGLVISYGGVIPIIATLGFSNIYRGATYIISDSQWVSAYQFDPEFKAFAQSSNLSFGLINNLFFISIICYIIMFIILKWTKFGRKIYAVGSNPEAAAVSGIRIRRVKFIVYGIAGLFAGLTGAMYTSLYASAQSDMGLGMEMDAIASCVIGGVSLSGGSGSVLGVFLGALTMSIISKSLPMIGVSQFWQTAIKGLIILVAIIINVLVQRTVKKSMLKERGV